MSALDSGSPAVRVCLSASVFTMRYRAYRERIYLSLNPFGLGYGAGNDRRRITDSVVGGWWLGLEGFIPPPVGALAGGPGPRRHSGRGTVGRTRQRCCAEPPPTAVGDDEILCRSGDGDDTAMVEPMVIRAYQHQVEQLGQTAVFPMHDVVG